MSLLNIDSSLPASVKIRARVEAQIARRVAEAFISRGFTVSVNDGEETTVKNSTDINVILDAMWTTDEDYLYINRDNGKRLGMVYFVYGNEGPDVIADYSMSLEFVMEEINAWVESEW